MTSPLVASVAWQALQQTDDLVTLSEVTKSQFADHPGMAQDQATLEQSHEGRLTDSQVVDPDGGVDKNHEAPVRRLGISVIVGSVPEPG